MIRRKLRLVLRRKKPRLKFEFGITQSKPKSCAAASQPSPPQLGNRIFYHNCMPINCYCVSFFILQHIGDLTRFGVTMQTFCFSLQLFRSFTDSEESGAGSVPAIAGASVGAVLLVLICVLVVACYCHRAKGMNVQSEKKWRKDREPSIVPVKMTCDFSENPAYGVHMPPYHDGVAIDNSKGNSIEMTQTNRSGDVNPYQVSGLRNPAFDRDHNPGPYQVSRLHNPALDQNVRTHKRSDQDQERYEHPRDQPRSNDHEYEIEPGIDTFKLSPGHEYEYQWKDAVVQC